MDPTLSVIVPILNEERLLPSFLNEINQCQREVDFHIECIFVDGGSKDRSVAICQAKQFSVIHGVAGRGQQLHIGGQNARGNVLLFLHVDSEVTSRHCRLAVETVQQNGIMAGGFRLQFDIAHPILKFATWANLLRFRCTKILYGDHGIFIRRDKYEKVGGFPTQALFEDVEFSRRLRRLGEVVMVPFALKTSARRFLKGGILRTYLLMGVLHLLFWIGVSPQKLASLYGNR